ncbi:type II toxin-antitoxin system MqsR family toxin [Luteimonas sp. WGS1318]|uniref:type II toxin-antitoxin system MqsR family toxin n=1 Tax=Luteimonas sp. WGS1318 TaxID=3366815 RepID=UPI00372D74B3
MPRTTPLYDLRTVQDLAKDGEHCRFTKNAEVRAELLGFNYDRCLEVIAWLSPVEFDRKLRYKSSGLSWDVYIVQGLLPPSRKKIYIKLRVYVDEGIEKLAVTSFHDEDLNRDDEDLI